MKRLKIYIGACLGSVLFTLSSCEPEMEFTNPSADSELNYYNTKEHLTYAVNGAYNMLQRAGGWARWMPFMLNARSDEYAFTSGAAAGEPETARLSQYTVNADLGSLSTTFQDMYTLQYAANLALEKLAANQDGAFDLNNTEDKNLYDRLRGEAIFLRGLSRFYLVYFFGDQIPDRDYVTTGGADYSLPPAESGQIYQRMVKDFQDASELLTAWNYEGTNDEGRATKGSALAFLAKCYMGRPILDGTAKAGDADWTSAKAVLEQIINSGAYGLMDNYRDNATEDNENNKESMFEVQFCQSSETQGFNPAAPGDLNSWVVTGQNTIRELELSAPNSTECGRWWNGMPSLALYNEFERDSEGKIIDPRAYLGMYIPDGCKFLGKSGKWLPYEELFSGGTFDAWRGKWFGCRKYSLDKVRSVEQSGINDRLIRYADILLMYAECCLETGDEATAKNYIQLVRNRANNNTVALNTTEADAGMSYLEGGKLPTVDELIANHPVVGRVVGNNGSVICEGMEINTVRRALKHE